MRITEYQTRFVKEVDPEIFGEKIAYGLSKIPLELRGNLSTYESTGLPDVFTNSNGEAERDYKVLTFYCQYRPVYIPDGWIDSIKTVTKEIFLFEKQLLVAGYTAVFKGYSVETADSGMGHCIKVCYDFTPKAKLIWALIPFLTPIVLPLSIPGFIYHDWIRPLWNKKLQKIKTRFRIK